MPRGFQIAPRTSLTPAMSAPSRQRRRAATEPTLPKPWMATVRPRSSRPRRLAAWYSTYTRPRPVASRRPADPPTIERFAGHHPRHALPLGHRVGVHDPGHRLLIGAEIRGRDVEIGPDEKDDLGGVAPREGLALPEGERTGVAANAALGASVGQAHEGALPAHQHGQGRHLAEVDVEIVAETALGGPERGVVMDPISHEHFGLARVHSDRDGHHEGPARVAKPLVNVRLEADPAGHAGRAGPPSCGTGSTRTRDVARHLSPFLLTRLRRGAQTTTEIDRRSNRSPR